MRGKSKAKKIKRKSNNSVAASRILYSTADRSHVPATAQSFKNSILGGTSTHSDWMNQTATEKEPSPKRKAKMKMKVDYSKQQSLQKLGFSTRQIEMVPSSLTSENKGRLTPSTSNKEALMKNQMLMKFNQDKKKKNRVHSKPLMAPKSKPGKKSNPESSRRGDASILLHKLDHNRYSNSRR